MVKLRNINRINGVVECDAYVESSEVPVHIKFDGETFTVGELPEGYDYCISHITHAKYFLRENYSSENLPTTVLMTPLLME